MKIVEELGSALKLVRIRKGQTQEDFGNVSSRTYMSVLENGRKSPSVKKIDELAHVMGVHPLTILTLAYMSLEKKDFENLNALIAQEIKDLTKV
jgi:transcriptional regulator with XRE-family HTH domain